MQYQVDIKDTVPSLHLVSQTCSVDKHTQPGESHIITTSKSPFIINFKLHSNHTTSTCSSQNTKHNTLWILNKLTYINHVF